MQQPTPNQLRLIDGEIRNEQMLVVHWNDNALIEVLLLPWDGKAEAFLAEHRKQMVDGNGGASRSLDRSLGLLGEMLEDRLVEGGESPIASHAPPPSGYREWHEWAEVQYNAGLRQKRCFVCKLWKFPQEMEFPEGRKPLCMVCVPA